MATTTAALISNVSRRLRDPSNIRHTKPEVLTVLNQCQRVLNYAKQSKLTTNSSVATAAGRTLYAVTTVHATAVQRIVEVKQDDRDLIEVDWRELVHGDERWIRRTGGRHELFARIGGDLFVLYPALTYASTVAVTYVKAPTTMVETPDTPPDLADELMPLLVDMAEAVLTVKNKQYDTLEQVLDKLRWGFGMDTTAGPGGK